MPNKAIQKKEVFATRQHIVSCFENIDCYLMMNPGLEVTENEDFDGKSKDIRKEFTQQLKDFVPYILAPENLIPKQINGRRIRAGELINYFIPYMEFFNSKEMPTPESIFDATARANNLTAMDAGFEQFCSIFTTISGMIHRIEDLDEIHSTYKNQACEKFNAEAKIGSKEFIHKYREMLKKKCDDIYKPVRKNTLKKLEEENGPVDAGFVVKLFYRFKKLFKSVAEDFVQSITETDRDIAGFVEKIRGFFP